MEKNITYLHSIQTSDEIRQDVKEENIRKRAIDLFIPLSDRIAALVEYYNQEQEQVSELISCITGMYVFSKTKRLKEYVAAISYEQRLPLMYRIDSAKQLDGDIRFEIIRSFFSDEKEQLTQLATPIRIDTILFLMQHSSYREESIGYFSTITLDPAIEVSYRFRVIQSIEHHFKGDEFLFYASFATRRFLLEEPLSTYRVIAAQYMYEMCEPDETMKRQIEDILLTIASTLDIDEDVRADACDVLLQYANDDARASARTALFVLAGGERVRNNIFRNAQNVHVRSIEESVERIVDKLCLYYPRNAKVYTSADFDTVTTEILSYFTEPSDDKTSVEGALLRIAIDRAVYGHSNMTLATVLVKLWTYISDSDHSAELHKRLIEELVESNNKCSTGYVSRLVNTLSGFDEAMSVTISFEDQIIANVEGRLNAAVLALTNEEEKDLIIEEMMVPVIMFHLRGHFLRFFREHISQIREEMYQEFREHMTDIDYDFYFRKAIIHYEGCY